jgi:hypothetical protein
MNPGLCYFAREEDYIYCNSCSIPKTQIHLVVEGFYCPVTKSGSFAAVPCCLVTLSSFQRMNPGLCYFAREEDYIYCNSCSIPKTYIHFVVEGSYSSVTKSCNFAAVPHC